MIVEMMAKGTYAGINLTTAGSRLGALEYVVSSRVGGRRRAARRRKPTPKR
jgi:hypothetical protein